MAEVASAFVTLVPSAKGFGSKISSQIGGDLDSAGKAGGKRLGGGLSSTFLPATKAMAGAAAGIFAAAKIGGFLKGSIAEAREAQKVGALTAQVIKTTGGAANVTAGQVANLATAISNKTGIDDEAIQSASNLLLTFTNVRNEVGKGNDIFNQATQAATDMGAALGGDPQSNAIKLGRALQDPTKGVTALTRSGVVFTAQQKEQIKTLQASGDTLGAQKIILAEINKEFGGAAAASATGGEKLRVAFDNLKETIGTALLPVIDKVAGFLTTRIIPAISTFFTQMQDGSGAGGAFVGFLKGIWTAVQPIGAFLMGTVVPAIRGFFASFQAGGGPSAITAAFQGLVGFIRGSIIPAVMGIVSAVRGFVVVALPIVQQFVAGMMARIGPLMPQVRAIFTTIGQIIVQALGLIRTVIVATTSVIRAVWSRWGSQIMNVVAAAFKVIVSVIGGALDVISGIIKLVTSVIKGDWSGAWTAIKQIVSGAWTVIKTVVSAALTVLKTTFSAALTALKGIATTAWANVKTAVSTGVTNAVNAVKSLPGQMVSALGDLGGLLLNAGSQLIQGLIDGITSRIGDLTGTVSGIASKIAGFFHGSPVKEGPLKQHGWNQNRPGKMLGDSLAAGMEASRRQVAAASRGLAGSVVVGGAAGTAGAASGRNIVIQGNVGWMPDDLDRVIAQRERREAALFPVFGGAY